MLSKLTTFFESGNVIAPPGASYLLSMVFKIYLPKPPGVDMPPERKPCLEHVLQSGTWVGQHLAYVLSLDFYWWQFNPRSRCVPRAEIILI